MKKKWKWIIAVVVLLLCFRACGSKPTKNAKPAATLPTVSQTEPTIPAATAPMTEAPTEPATEPETAPSSGIRPEFRAAMDAYEAFYEEYCTFMEDYMKNPTDLSLLGKYAGMLTKVAEMDEAFNAWNESDLSSEELKYYLEVNTRIQKRLLDLL